MRLLYSLLLFLALPLLLLYFVWRGFKNPLYWRHWKELFLSGRSSEPVIWLHAASVGEFQAALPFIRGIIQRYPQGRVLLTTTSPTGLARVRALLGEEVLSTLLPLDLGWLCTRFLASYKPCVAIFMETEIWPNMFFTCQRRGIPLLIANARLSDAKIRSYQRFSSLFLPVLNGVNTIACQSETDRERYLKIGVRPDLLQVAGNLKFDIALPAGADHKEAEIGQLLGKNRRVWVAASTREGEEGQLLQAFQDLLSDYPELLLVLVPRHPERFEQVAELIAKAGLDLVRRSMNQPCTEDTQVYLLDSVGELFGFYSAAELVFVGGSLVPVGGHNILEPALWSKPVIVGPYTDNLKDVVTTFLEADGLLQVADSKELRLKVQGLLDNPAAASAIAAKGHALIAQNQGASARLLEILGAIAPKC